MTVTKLQQEKTKVKYQYDYPENREVARNLTFEDKRLIAQKTGFSDTYVRNWCQGKRRNRRIGELAATIARMNVAKQRRLERQFNSGKN